MAPRVRAVLLLVLAIALAGLCAAGRDYYEVLGVERDASTTEIKRAFRKLSLKVRCVAPGSGHSGTDNRWLCSTIPIRILATKRRRRSSQRSLEVRASRSHADSCIIH